MDISTIKSLYMHSEGCVRVNSVTTEPFRASVGLRQGCSLSPILFLIYMDRMVKKSESCGGVKIGERTIQRLLCAHDLVLLDSIQNGLQQALDRFSHACFCGRNENQYNKNGNHVPVQTTKAVLSPN